MNYPKRINNSNKEIKKKNSIFNLIISNFFINCIKLMLEPYAIKVACTVLRGGNISNNMTYLDRPYAALLLLVIGYDIMSCSA